MTKKLNRPCAMNQEIRATNARSNVTRLSHHAITEASMHHNSHNCQTALYTSEREVTRE